MRTTSTSLAQGKRSPRAWLVAPHWDKHVADTNRDHSPNRLGTKKMCRKGGCIRISRNFDISISACLLMMGVHYTLRQEHIVFRLISNVSCSTENRRLVSELKPERVQFPATFQIKM